MLMYVLVSIVVLTLLLWQLNSYFPKLFCPICLASVITWCVLLLSFLLGRNIDVTVLVVLMSVSLGATIEKYGARFGLLWKTLMLVVGVPAVYFLSLKDIPKTSVLIFSMVVLLALSLIFKKSSNKEEDAFDRCCN